MAIKYVCDICGKESDAMHKYSLPYKNTVYATGANGEKLMSFDNGYTPKDVDVCAACEITIYSVVKYINKMAFEVQRRI